MRETSWFEGFFGCRGGIRTPDLQVMSLTSYRTAPPCNLVMKGEPVKSRKSKMQPFFNLECTIFQVSLLLANGTSSPVCALPAGRYSRGESHDLLNKREF